MISMAEAGDTQVDIVFEKWCQILNNPDITMISLQKG